MAAVAASSDSKPTELKDLISDEEFKSKQLIIDSDLSDVCKAAIGAYALLVSIVFGFAENYEHATEHLRPSEKTVAAAAAGACAAAGLASLCRLQLQKSPIGSKSVHLCVTLVHLIAACTNFILWYLPMPVVHNRFTGNPVYIMRWCEWTVLSFVMQFLIESVGRVPEKYSFRSCFLWAACMCGSTACGLFFPFMPNFFSFAVLLFISCWLYFLIFPRLFTLGKEARESTDSRLRVAYQLQLTCAFTWTLFVLVWFGNWIWAAFNPGSEASSWPFYLEASIDVCAKVLYASAIEGLDQEKHETQRESQSKKVSELMTTIWTLCGDVFVLSNQPSGLDSDSCTSWISDPANAIVSPAVKSMLGCNHGPESDEEGSSSNPIGSSGLLAVSRGLWDAADEKYRVTEHQLCHVDGRKISTEIGSVKNDAGSSGMWLVAVVRNVTDRVQREAVERKLELTDLNRSKDLEAARFARHEIKNGIINSLNLLISVQEMVSGGIQDEMFASTDYAMNMLTHCRNTKGELDSTLSAVLCDAAVRDLVHDNYKARPEALHVPDFIKKLFSGPQFVIESNPHNFPVLTVDKFLIKIAGQNAVSNGIKYGKTNGIIKIIVTYQHKLLSIDFINEPGAFHDELLQVDPKQVFNPGTRLEVHQRDGGVASERSCGDGTWIMALCATAMEGSCDLTFKPDCTVMTLKCKTEMFIDDEVSAQFELPQNCIVAFIDDAAVQ